MFQITKSVVKMCVECVNVSVEYYGSLCLAWNFLKVVTSGSLMLICGCSWCWNFIYC